MSDIATLISSLGFPIAMCLALMWFAKYQYDGHHNETQQFIDSLNKNTLVIQKLCDKLDSEDDINVDN